MHLHFFKSFLLLHIVVGYGTMSCTDSLADEALKKVRLRFVNGSSIRGDIESIDSSGSIVGSSKLANAKLEDLLSIDTGRQIANPANAGPQVFLRLGGRLNVGKLTFENDFVTATVGEGQQTFPAELVASIVFNTTDKVSETISAASNRFDSVVVQGKRGEVVVSGLVEKVDATHVYMDHKGKSRKISLAKINALVFAVVEVQQPKSTRVRVHLVDGSVVGGGLNEMAKGVLKLGLADDYVYELPVESIAKIDVDSDSVVYLSDLEPVQFEQQAQFALPRQWQRDKSLLGNPIQLKYAGTGRVIRFNKGIGTRSYTSISFNNNKQFSHLRTVVGIDAETKGNGDCEMVIEGDGIRLWSDRVTGNSDPQPVVVSIADIDEVSLIVLPGNNFDLADHAVWADAKFTKSN